MSQNVPTLRNCEWSSMVLLCWLFQFSLGCTCGANVDDVGAWQQYLSGLGFAFFAFWVPILVQICIHFCTHFGTPNWCPILGLSMIVAKRFLKLGPFRDQKWDPFGGLKGFLFMVGWAIFLESVGLFLDLAGMPKARQRQRAVSSNVGACFG